MSIFCSSHTLFKYFGFYFKQIKLEKIFAHELSKTINLLYFMCDQFDDKMTNCYLALTLRKQSMYKLIFEIIYEHCIITLVKIKIHAF